MEVVFWLLVFSVVGWCASGTEQNTAYYNGYRVFRLIPSTLQHIKALKDLENDITLDVWRHPHNLGDNYDVMVKPEDHSKFVERLTNHNIEFQVLLDDVEKILNDERRHFRRRKKRALSSISAYTTNFLNVQEIEEFLLKVKETSRDVNVTISSIGQSSLGQNLTVAKIYKASSHRKPAIFIDAGIHAREWIAPAMAINFIYQLALNPNRDRQVSRLLNKYDWYIMPVANPDGYQFSIYSDRMWRKTRNDNPGSVYKGTDANRNFNYRWNPDVGGSRNPGEDTYAGSAPFSIPESRDLGRFLMEHGSQIKLYLTLHSYGQYLLYPWGYGPHEFASDQNDLERLARVADRAMPETYRTGTSSVVLYPAAGGSDDFAKGVAGIKYSYTMELPPPDTADNNTYGFIVNPRDIPTIARDTWQGVKALALELHRTLRANRTSHDDDYAA
ncbi:carboxypeptidase B-like [Gigantopelta aegis]|uniref:carboxypeptidase B-like n=1 Tax=Gigantopelta aegis TaxID=1735272 RepID=UPI001B88D6BD|nr:carboxypeptidase B-like [Gigantopelta aegis]